MRDKQLGSAADLYIAEHGASNEKTGNLFCVKFQTVARKMAKELG